MGWNQFHCEDYQILIPMNVHGSKSELEWSRCHENRDNALIDAPLTFESHNFWSDCWIFKIHTFLETGSQDLSRSVKINMTEAFWRWWPYKGRCFKNRAAAIKGPRHPSDQKKKKTPGLPALCLDEFKAFLISSKHKKHIKPSRFFLHQKYKVLFLYPIFFSLVLHFGFGV